ncbi:MAG: hypothetical protein JW781_06605 [Deltaproteobacteria bacterium]|nr:hypothetical protein [Candidatus Anaeroferrophillacea bacterium]
MKQLWRLQEVDHALADLEGRLSGYDDRIAAMTREADDTGARIAALRDELAGREHEREKFQRDVDRHRRMIRQAKEKLTHIKNNKEYFAAAKEIEYNEKDVKEIESNLLQLMEVVEGLEAELKELTAKIDAQHGEIDRCRAEYAERSRLVDTELAVCRKRREELVEHVDRRILRRYDRVRTRFIDAVVKVENEACGGCHVSVPPQVYINLLKGEEFMDCPNCMRIIFHDAGEEAVTAAADADAEKAVAGNG